LPKTQQHKQYTILKFPYLAIWVWFWWRDKFLWFWHCLKKMVIYICTIYMAKHSIQN